MSEDSLKLFIPPPPAEEQGDPVDIEAAIRICTAVEGAISRNLPCHVALTGGVLYKDGSRKDLDLLFYRVRQYEHPAKESILCILRAIGFEIINEYNWCTKAKYEGVNIDLFFPELYPEISTSNEEY